MASRLGVLALLAASSACGLGGGSYTPVRTAFNRGVHLASVGELEAALVEYRDALRADPDDYRARFNLASTLEDLADRDRDRRPDAARGHREEAEAEYRRLLERKPGELRASINLALLEYAKGQSDAAYRRLGATIAAHSDDPRALAARARLEWLDDRPEAASESLRAALAIDPTDLASNLMLGDLLRTRGEIAEARTAYRAALRRDDGQLAAWFALGELELAAEEFIDARAAFERVLMLDPDHHRARLGLADTLESLGETEAAELQRLTVKAARSR